MFILNLVILGCFIGGGTPGFQVTWPEGVTSKKSASGIVYTPMNSSDVSEIDWNELLKDLGVDDADLGPPPIHRKLPSVSGREIDNLIEFYREALHNPDVVAALAERNPQRIPPEYKLYVSPLIRDSNLRRGDWNPTSFSSDDGIVVLPSPWVYENHEYYIGAVFLPGDLMTIKRHECDYRDQLFDIGQNYKEIWPVEGTRRWGHNTFGEFNTRGVFTVQKLQWPFELAHYQWFIDHYIDDTLIADFMLVPQRFPGYVPMKWLRGRVIFLRVVHNGNLIGYIVVPSVGFHVEVDIAKILKFTDKPKDHEKAMRAFLGNWKRKVEGWIQR